MSALRKNLRQNEINFITKNKAQKNFVIDFPLPPPPYFKNKRFQGLDICLGVQFSRRQPLRIFKFIVIPGISLKACLIRKKKGTSGLDVVVVPFHIRHTQTTPLMRMIKEFVSQSIQSKGRFLIYSEETISNAYSQGHAVQTET